MKQIDFEGWEVYTTDGYGHQHYAYFTEFSDAAKAAGDDPYKGTSPVKKSMVVFESFAEYEDYKVQSKRRAALDKLTLEERKILGLEK